MDMKLFPEEAKAMSIEVVAAKLSYFYEQTHLIHWQTTSFAQHQALGSLYDKLVDFKDDIIERLMGYTGQRPKAFKIDSLVDNINPLTLVSSISSFAITLKKWSETNNYTDISNIADALSGEVQKTKYLLTLS